MQGDLVPKVTPHHNRSLDTEAAVPTSLPAGCPSRNRFITSSQSNASILALWTPPPPLNHNLDPVLVFYHLTFQPLRRHIKGFCSTSLQLLESLFYRAGLSITPRHNRFFLKKLSFLFRMDWVETALNPKYSSPPGVDLFTSFHHTLRRNYRTVLGSPRGIWNNRFWAKHLSNPDYYIKSFWVSILCQESRASRTTLLFLWVLVTRFLGFIV